MKTYCLSYFSLHLITSGREQLLIRQEMCSLKIFFPEFPQVVSDLALSTDTIQGSNIHT